MFNADPLTNNKVYHSSPWQMLLPSSCAMSCRYSLSAAGTNAALNLWTFYLLLGGLIKRRGINNHIYVKKFKCKVLLCLHATYV